MTALCLNITFFKNGEKEQPQERFCIPFSAWVLKKLWKNLSISFGGKDLNP